VETCAPLLRLLRVECLICPVRYRSDGHRPFLRKPERRYRVHASFLRPHALPLASRCRRYRSCKRRHTTSRRGFGLFRILISTAAYLVATAVGLVIAVALLSGFVIDPLSFVVAVAIFSLVQTMLGPPITKISIKSFPQLMSGRRRACHRRHADRWHLQPARRHTPVWIGSLIASILLPISV